MTTDLDMAALEPWIGRTATMGLVLDPWPAMALAAALDRDEPLSAGDPLPPFWHHLYGHQPVRADETGEDGHPKRGGFLPPVPLPRRMWAGGRLRFQNELRLGEKVERRSQVRSIIRKDGRQGPLVFVMVEHQLAKAKGGVAVVEEHDIVYRQPPRAGSEAAAPQIETTGQWQQRWRPDEVLLFRYSALTYNGHRIHYDLDYVREVEGYPGLIVHGPLLATLMLELVRRERPYQRITRFSFRATSPVFANQQIVVHGTPEDGNQARAKLWIEGPDDRLCMVGEVELT